MDRQRAGRRHPRRFIAQRVTVVTMARVFTPSRIYVVPLPFLKSA